MSRKNPVVSVVLTTHNRHDFLPIALRCYRHQTYAERELIVVDDSRQPIDAAAVAGVGGHLIRMEPGTPLGVKLNHGFAHAGGDLFQKMDDDDWYAPDFLQRMVGAYQWANCTLCRPAILCMVTYPFFDLARWALRMHGENEMSGATLLFPQLLWEDSPFRPIPKALDNWFIHDLVTHGGSPQPVQALNSFIQLRHRGHLWTRQMDGTPVDELLRGLPILPGGPEARLPAWALEAYRHARVRLLEETSETVRPGRDM